MAQARKESLGSVVLFSRLLLDLRCVRNTFENAVFSRVLPGHVRGRDGSRHLAVHMPTSSDRFLFRDFD